MAISRVGTHACGSAIIATQHLLSITRVFLGILVLAELRSAPESYLVLPAVLAACVLDYYDGRVARARDADSSSGRLIDNLCDGVFLALCFAGFALIAVWSDPRSGSATRYWQHANWLPLIMLSGSFGAYMLRWAVSKQRRVELARSTRGHGAGIFNYVLAILGGIAVLPNFEVSEWILEPAFVTVALLNATAISENVLLLIAVVRE